MSQLLRRGFFVTGTDTGVGKTLVSATLLREFVGRGLRVAGMKPVASGARWTPAGLRNEDALSLIREQSRVSPYAVVNPYAFLPAIAPHIAAAQAGIKIDIERIVQAFNELHAGGHIVVVEGAGGWYAPISESSTMEDVALALGLPVVLVVGLRLGCLNHALLTARVIERSSLPLCGWIANRIDLPFPHWQENVSTLTRLLAAPYLGTIDYQPSVTIEHAAGSLNVDLLLTRLPADPHPA
ncbi:MAG: dethiobiotin synthase [Steroidobacteraceae bacterium]